MRHFLCVIFLLATTSAVLAEGKKYALLIGVQKYDDPQLKEYEHAEDDLKALEKVLSASEYKVRALINPSGKSMGDAVDAIAKECGKDDLLLVAYCGHGVNFNDDKNGYLCPQDAKVTEKKSLISSQKILDKIGASKASTKMLLADANRIESTKTLRGLQTEDLGKTGTVLALLANSNADSPITNEAKRGVFFHKVIQGFGGAAVDGNDDITFKSLAKYLDAPVDAPEKPGSGTALTRHPQAIPVAEWKEYYEFWLYRGRGTKPFLQQHAPKRFEAWKKSAEAGSPRGMMLLADCYEFNIGVAKPDIKAVANWYKRSAEAGNTFAMEGLALCYEKGLGVFPDKKISLMWFTKAAELGDASAMLSLSIRYSMGNGVKKDPAEAHRWMVKSAESGSADALIMLGYEQLGEVTVVRNYDSALKYFEKAADLGNCRAQGTLGSFYLEGRLVKKDVPRAISFLEQAAAQDEDDAQFVLGMVHLLGKEVEKDAKTAHKWFLKSADRGNDYGMIMLGDMLMSGTGVKKDQAAGLDWYRKSAEKNNSRAMMRLADCYISGIGVKKDVKESIKWLQQAANLGNKEAEEILKGFDK